jgi:hypothetical protein
MSLLLFLSACSIDDLIGIEAPPLDEATPTACSSEIWVETTEYDPEVPEPAEESRVPVEDGSVLWAFKLGDDFRIDLWTVAYPEASDDCEIFLRLDPDEYGEAPYWATGHASFSAAEVSDRAGECQKTDDTSRITVRPTTGDDVRGPHVLQMTTSCPESDDDVISYNVMVDWISDTDPRVGGMD